MPLQILGPKKEKPSSNSASLSGSKAFHLGGCFAERPPPDTRSRNWVWRWDFYNDHHLLNACLLTSHRTNKNARSHPLRSSQAIRLVVWRMIICLRRWRFMPVTIPCISDIWIKLAIQVLAFTGLTLHGYRQVLLKLVQTIWTNK
ncbi:hypothetical protein J6590_067627 [Homalodisca vitripennis]|nr:hypothetical protein J6590_067627 [Homalodisca vitripennis]